MKNAFAFIVTFVTFLGPVNSIAAPKAGGTVVSTMLGSTTCSEKFKTFRTQGAPASKSNDAAPASSGRVSGQIAEAPSNVPVYRQ